MNHPPSQSKLDFIAKILIATKEAREARYRLILLAAADVASVEKLVDIAEDRNHPVPSLIANSASSRNHKY